MEKISMTTTNNSLVREEVDVEKPIKLTETQISLLDSLIPGDVVWAKMPINANKEQTSIRPYLVVLAAPFNIYAYHLSDIWNKKLNNYETYGIISGKYNNSKNLWLNLSNVVKIPVNNVVSKMMHLRNDDLEMIEKRLQIQTNRNKYSKQMFELPFYISEGDVVMFNSNKYYVYAIYDKKLYCYSFSNTQTDELNSKIVRINRRQFYMNFSNQVVINSKDAEIIDIASVSEILYIERIKKLIKEKTKKKDLLPKYEIGSVFKCKNMEIMFLYEKNDKFYFVDYHRYKIFPRLIQFDKLPESQKFIEISNSETIEKIIRHLIEKLPNPPKELKRMYSEMF